MKLIAPLFLFLASANCALRYWDAQSHRPQATYSTCVSACQDIKSATFMRRQCMACCESRKDRNSCLPKTTVVAFTGQRYQDHRGPIANMYRPLYGGGQKRVAQILK